MGGFGSGRRNGKACADDMRQVDVRGLQRDGHLRPGTSCRMQWFRNGRVTAGVELSATAEAVTFIGSAPRRPGLQTLSLALADAVAGDGIAVWASTRRRCGRYMTSLRGSAGRAGLHTAKTDDLPVLPRARVDAAPSPDDPKQAPSL
jgi:hypothetical protein